jgi:cysteine peptidase C11 family protein
MTNQENLKNAGNSPSESETPLAEWTIMIYMAGDNNLSDDCVNALKAVQSVKTGDLIHVIAQFDPADTRVSSHRVVMNLRDKKDPKGTTLLGPNSPSKLSKDFVEIEEGPIKFGGRARQERQAAQGETDTADPKTLFDFISWCTHNYKANRYMLVLAGHSAGVEEGYLLKDENPVHSMSLSGLMQVLSEAKQKLVQKLDILGMDACLMSMIEICHELSTLGDFVDYYVSCQSMTPNPGWPYAQIVDDLMRDRGKLEAKELAGIIVNKYVNSYVENAVCSGVATDQAAVKISATEGVVKSVRELGALLRQNMGNGSGNSFNRALVHAHWEAQSYNGERFVDLQDFCDRVATYCDDADVKKAANNVTTALKDMVLTSCFCGIDYQYSHGLSIYFPWSTIFSYYRYLGFAKASGADWANFLEAYVERTRREPRGGDGPGPFRSLLDDRKVPPYDHGPALPADSMRNPPRKWSKEGISDCIEDKQQWSEIFDSFR